MYVPARCTKYLEILKLNFKNYLLIFILLLLIFDQIKMNGHTLRLREILYPDTYTDNI